MRRRAVAEEVDQRGGGGHPCVERAPGAGHHGTGWRGQRNPSGLAQLVVRRWAAPIDVSGGVVES